MRLRLAVCLLVFYVVCLLSLFWQFGLMCLEVRRGESGWYGGVSGEDKDWEEFQTSFMMG